MDINMNNLQLVLRKLEKVICWLLWATGELWTSLGGSRRGLTRLVPFTLLITRSKSTILEKFRPFDLKVISKGECAGSFVNFNILVKQYEELKLENIELICKHYSSYESSAVLILKI